MHHKGAETLTIIKNISIKPLRWKLFFGTPLFKGLLHLNFGATKFGPGKMFTYLIVYYLYWRHTLFRGKGHFFWISKHRFNLHSGDTLLSNVADHKKAR